MGKQGDLKASKLGTVAKIILGQMKVIGPLTYAAT
jgi:hypothetical protein